MRKQMCDVMLSLSLGDVSDAQSYPLRPFVMRLNQICLCDFVKACMGALRGKHSSHGMQ